MSKAGYVQMGKADCSRMGMMKNLSTTLAPYNIAVNDVAPVS